MQTFSYQKVEYSVDRNWLGSKCFAFDIPGGTFVAVSFVFCSVWFYF